MLFNSSGDLFVVNSGNSTISKVTTNGNVSLFATLNLSAPATIAEDQNGDFFVGDGSGPKIDEVTTNGDVSTFISEVGQPNTGANVGASVAISPESVPEPSTYVLLGLGALVLLITYRRKIA